MRGRRATGSCVLSTEVATKSPHLARYASGGGQLVGVHGRFAVHPVADAAHGHDLEGRLILELLAEPANVHVDGLPIARELVPPYILEQHVTCMHSSRKGEQVRDEVELAGRELDLRAIQRDPARGAIDVERADRVVLWDRLGFVRSG